LLHYTVFSHTNGIIVSSLWWLMEALAHRVQIISLLVKVTFSFYIWSCPSILLLSFFCYLISEFWIRSSLKDPFQCLSFVFSISIFAFRELFFSYYYSCFPILIFSFSSFLHIVLLSFDYSSSTNFVVFVRTCTD